MTLSTSSIHLQQVLNQHLPLANLVASELPLVPEIKLWLLDDIFDQQGLDPVTAEALMDNPPYWVFCWASGQILARYLLDHPQQVRGKVVLDLGPGSGVVAIAAALAGARRVIACDLDPQSLMAVRANSDLNKVTIEVTQSLDAVLAEADLVTVADILYDRDNWPLLAKLRQCPWVLLADSRVKNLAEPGYELIDQATATTWPDLSESLEYNQVRLYQALE